MKRIDLPAAYANESRDLYSSAEIVAYAIYLADVTLGEIVLATDDSETIVAVLVDDIIAPAVGPALHLAAAFGDAGPLADYFQTPAGRSARASVVVGVITGGENNVVFPLAS